MANTDAGVERASLPTRGFSYVNCGHVEVGTCPHQVLAATLTLFQPGEADYTHHIMMSPQRFESHVLKPKSMKQKYHATTL